MNNETRPIKYKFNPVELSERAHLMAEKEREVENLEEEKKEYTSDLNARIKEARGIVRRCAQDINQGWTTREMAVLLRPDYDTGEMVIVIASTGEEVERRDLTSEERQLRIDDFPQE